MTQAQITLLDCEYFPCIAWYQSFVQAQHLSIEMYEHFVRSSYRNRCELTGPNGKIMLSIPLESGRNQRTLMKDTKVCNRQAWQALHWKTLVACYGRAPYFEYYEAPLQSFFQKKFVYLTDVNLEAIALINRLLRIDNTWNLTTHYEKYPQQPTLDLRTTYSPHQAINKTFTPYIQNFEERNGFQPNLSILDMLFCLGNHSLDVLLKP